MPDPSAASRPELLHRDHVLHELIGGDLGALLKARRFVFLEVRSMRLPPVLVGLPTAAIVAACAASAAPPAVAVVATDYAFGAPDTVAPGVTTFTFTNRGAQQHEMLIGLLRPGVAAAQVVAAARHGTTFRSLPEVYLEGAMHGALFAWPRTASPARLTVDLVRGRTYVLLCTFRDSTTAPQHAALGMFHLLQVR